MKKWFVLILSFICTLCVCLVVGSCQFLGGTNTSTHEHTWEKKWTIDDNEHWRACTGCEEKENQGKHTLNLDGMCEVCRQAIGPTPGVTYKVSSNDKYVEVIRYSGNAKIVRVAEEYQGLPVTIIKSEAFKYCQATTILLPDSISSVESNAFMDCRKLTFTEYGNCKYLGNENNPHLVLVQTSDIYLASYTIHENTKIIADAAFSGCHQMESIVIPDKVKTIGDGAFGYCSGLKNAQIGKSVETIGDKAFRYDSNLMEIVVPDSVREIGEVAFEGCTSLMRAEIGSGVMLIGKYAFYGCQCLTVYCKAEEELSGWISGWAHAPVVWDCQYNNMATDRYVYTIVNGMRYAINGTAMVARQPSNLTTANIQDTILFGGREYPVDTMKEGAFESCDKLREVYYTGTMAQWCELTIENTMANPLHNGAKLYIENVFIENLVIPETVTKLGARTFAQYGHLKSVTYGDTLTEIGEGAFFACTGLTTLEIAKNVKKIGQEAFKDCDGLTNVVIDGAVDDIGHYAFENCDKLTSVSIGNQVKTIGIKAFAYCVELTNLTLGNSVNDIGSGAFSECKKLASVQFPNSLHRIADSAFRYCESLTEVVIPDGDIIILSSAFYQCSGLTSVVLGEGVDMNSGAVDQCSNLARIVLPSTLTELQGMMFNGCDNLTEIVFRGTVEAWNAINKAPTWNRYIPATKVVCTDGEVAI